jgi:hypothetical protein
MPSTFAFALPTKAAAVPASSAYLHEIKHDGQGGDGVQESSL